MHDERSPASRWFRDAVENYESQLIRYATRLLGDADRARDVVQDTFVKLCRETPTELDGHMAQWLFAVCRNRALDVRKKEARMKEFTEVESSACVDTNSDHVAAIAAKDLATQVHEMMDQLSENQRDVVRLKFENGLSYRQISHITKLSVSNVGYLIHTALQQLRTKLNEK